MPIKSTQNTRIEGLRPLLPPSILQEEIPATAKAFRGVTQYRHSIARALQGKEKRLVVVVGPCSIHDPKAALDYAGRLMRVSDALSDDLIIVMRCYFEKPRTTVGWKGLINDPRLDGSYAINEGLRAARRVLRDITELGLPTGCEFLDPISPQFVADLVSWAAIGARTTESQVHRELASGSSMPIGFKNGTDGSVQVAVEGVVAGGHPHSFLSVSEQGLASIVSTRGNPDCHVILRGGNNATNYHSEAIQQAKERLVKAGLVPRLMVDASHGNSEKDYRRQPLVVDNLCAQIIAGERGIFGVMLESFLVAGRQDISRKLHYGQSVTDGCMSWETSVKVLRQLAKAHAKRPTGHGKLQRK